MKKKKILFIIWSYTFGGGAEKMLTTIVNNLDVNKYDIDIVEYWHSSIGHEKPNSSINVLPPIINDENASKLKRYIYQFIVYFFPFLFRKKFKKNDYDVEISFNYMIPSFLLSHKKNVKTISWIHGAIWDLKDSKLTRFLQKRSLKRVSKIICIADDTKVSVDTLYPEYSHKSKVIYNGYDFNLIKTLAENKKIKKGEKFELIYCNRFDDNKNPLFLIEAAKLLLSKTSDFHISFLGKGNLETEMLNRIKLYSLEKNISILGFKENPYPYILNSDLICLTSLNEGFSNFIVEGLVFNKPFVSTDVGIVREIKKYNIGIVANTPNDFANAIYSFITNKTLYDKCSFNCKKVAEKFNIKSKIIEIENIIDKLFDKE